MRLAIIALLMISGQAQAYTPLKPDPRIRSCTKVEQDYGRWALALRRMLEKNSSDIGGRVDVAFLQDINFALASAGDFVHTNIQVVQRAKAFGGEPSVRACRAITASARDQIEQYVGHLVSEVQPSDRWSRESRLEEFRVGLYESSRRFQDY